MGKRKRNLASLISEARALQLAEEDAMIDGKEKIEKARIYGIRRTRLMREILPGLKSGEATTQDQCLDADLVWHSDPNREVPWPNDHHRLPIELFRGRQLD